MNAIYGNELLNEYYSQVSNALTEEEKRVYDAYSFYEVYTVEILGEEAEGGICCPILLFGGACVFLFCMPDTACGLGCADNLCDCCLTECWNDTCAQCCPCLECESGCECLDCCIEEDKGGVITPDTGNNRCSCACINKISDCGND